MMSCIEGVGGSRYCDSAWHGGRVLKGCMMSRTLHLRQGLVR